MSFDAQICLSAGGQVFLSLTHLYYAADGHLLWLSAGRREAEEVIERSHQV